MQNGWDNDPYPVEHTIKTICRKRQEDKFELMESVDCDTDTFEYSADIIITNLKIERARKTHIMALTIMLNRNLTRPACSFSLYAEDAKLVHICHGIILFLFIDSSKDEAKFIDKTY